jgi:hypothetical protein
LSNTERPYNIRVDSTAELTGTGIIIDGVSNNFSEYLGLKLMPNPVQNTLTIENSGAFLNADKVSVIDLNGRVLIENPIKGLQGRYEINTSTLVSGVYILRIHIGDRVISEQFSVGR